MSARASFLVLHEPVMNALSLQRGEEALNGSIIPAVVLAAHAARDGGFRKQNLIAGGDVLTAAI